LGGVGDGEYASGCLDSELTLFQLAMFSVLSSRSMPKYLLGMWGCISLSSISSQRYWPETSSSYLSYGMHHLGTAFQTASLGRSPQRPCSMYSAAWPCPQTVTRCKSSTPTVHFVPH
jgi:hypothetical protein